MNLGYILVLFTIAGLAFLPNGAAEVDPISGAFVITRVDLSSDNPNESKRFSLEEHPLIVRRYNSLSNFDGIFGKGWCSNLETQLRFTTDGEPRELAFCGGEHFLLVDILRKESGFETTNLGFKATTRNAFLHFDQMGRLTSWENLSGDKIQIAYYSGSQIRALNYKGQVIDMAISNNRTTALRTKGKSLIEYAYTNGSLSRVTSSVVTESYTYDSKGRIVKATNNGLSYKVHYQNNHIVDFITKYDGCKHSWRKRGSMYENVIQCGKVSAIKTPAIPPNSIHIQNPSFLTDGSGAERPTVYLDHGVPSLKMQKGEQQNKGDKLDLPEISKIKIEPKAIREISSDENDQRPLPVAVEIKRQGKPSRVYFQRDLSGRLTKVQDQDLIVTAQYTKGGLLYKVSDNRARSYHYLDKSKTKQNSNELNNYFTDLHRLANSYFGSDFNQ